MKDINPRSQCPISYSLDIFGDRWTLLILRDMIFYGKCSYSEFLASNEKIATNILIDRLSVLYSQGFINKHTAPTKKSKFLYTLTDKAIKTIPIIIEIAIWGDEFSPFKMPKTILEPFIKNKDKTIKALSQKLKKERDFLLQNQDPK